MKKQLQKMFIAGLCICGILCSDLSMRLVNAEENQGTEAGPEIQIVHEDETAQYSEDETVQYSEDGQSTGENQNPEAQNDNEIQDSEESGNADDAQNPEEEQGESNSLEVVGIDENGNIFIVEPETDGVVAEPEISAQAEGDIKLVNFRATSSGTPVTDITTYQEYGTGADGYTYGGAGADAAYLGMENGKVKFMQAGVVGLVDASKVQIVSMGNVRGYSHYYADGTNLYHRISMDLNSSGYGGNVYVGPQQSYMTKGQKYYSYDGHYFYTNYETMLNDYRNNTRAHSINPNSPYYNYFQYLPMRGKSQYSASELSAMINGRVSGDSKMYNTGSSFVEKQNTYGVNALLMASVGAVESGWGMSSISQSKNNLFGIGAVDSSPGESAYQFSSPDACIKDFAETYMSKRYLRAGYTYYNGGFLGDKASGINVSYGSAPYWGEIVASIAWMLDGANGGKDQYYYTIGVKDRLATAHTELNVCKEATTASSSLYATGKKSNYAFLILGESGGFYKVQSDPVLNSGRTQINSTSGVYSAANMYGYVSKDYVAVVSNGASGGTVTPTPAVNGITYSTHVQTYGWLETCADGALSGTEGEAKRAEAIKVQLSQQKYSGSVQYRTHVQTYGWLDWVSDGTVSGTEGQAKRMEALQVKLTGDMAEHYDIYYRVHVQTYGWLDWAKNGEIAGTTDVAKRLEAIQIILVEKGGTAPGNTDRPYIQPLIQYRTHVQTYGWLDYMMGGGYSGTTGQAKRLEAIQIQLLDQKYSGSLQYRVHVQTYGWQNWVNENAAAGTTGQAKRLEAIQIRLTGEMAKQYDIYYRVHVQTYGWLDWAKNGEEAGTAGLAKRMESIQIVLMKKGAEAPGSMERAYICE